MKTKYYIPLILITLLPSVTMAKDPALKKRISAIESAYRSWSDLSVDFTQVTFVELIGKKVKKSGKMQLKKKGKLRIAYEGKNEKTYLSDGNILWVYIPGDDASIESFIADSESIPKEALKFLSGFGKLGREFKIAESSEFPKHRPDHTPLNLTPKSKVAHYKSLDVLFGPDNIFTELIINNVSGNRSHYKFSNIKTDQGLSDRIFTLSKGKATPDTPPK